MTFNSILFRKDGYSSLFGNISEPDHFVDLNLDQIIDAITDGKEEYNLKPIYYIPLREIDAVKYRQEVMQDLETDFLLESIKSFAQKMREMRRYLALTEKLYYVYHKEGWLLEATEVYCEAVTCLAQDLNQVELKSRGLLAFREYITNYAGSIGFNALLEETKRLKANLAAVQYCVLIRGNTVKVSKYEAEIDYSPEVEKTFMKFRQGAVKDYLVKLPVGSGMNHVEAQILEMVAKLYPDLFSSLDEYCTKHSKFVDETVGAFDREIQFYVAYLDYVEVFKKAGLKFCFPHITKKSKEVYDYDGFDLALAGKRTSDLSTIVCNDFYLKDKERILVITGPNQGGKTTFARTFGQLHYLASLGCPVPGRRAQLFLFDRIFTHFEKEEDISNLRGKLQDDLVRIHDMLDTATSDSILIMNEIFTSTTLNDAIFLSKEILQKIIQQDMLCVCVTFIDELASLSEKTVSMMSTVDPENPALRTYKIIRRPADGLAYAISVAEKYHLTYERILERMQS